MARSQITSTADDLMSDTGAVLWSIVRGEQLEYPVILSFLNEASAGHTFEAVVVEALNAVDGTKPTTIQPGGIQTTLVTRTAVPRGTWDGTNTYQRENFVSHASKYYKLNNQIDYVNATTPDVDANWSEFDPRTLYLQFPKTLSSDWAEAPTAEFNIFGFFELRVTEPSSVVYPRTWKPIRGLVEMLFSPTDITPDI